MSDLDWTLLAILVAALLVVTVGLLQLRSLRRASLGLQEDATKLRRLLARASVERQPELYGTPGPRAARRPRSLSGPSPRGPPAG